MISPNLTSPHLKLSWFFPKVGLRAPVATASDAKVTLDSDICNALSFDFTDHLS